MLLSCGMIEALPAKRLDVVLPCYNPAEGWVEKVLEAWAHIHVALPDLQIGLILVNDGSTKGLEAQHLQLLQSSLPELHYIDSQPNMGKGYALRKGVQASSAELLIYTDIDFPYQEESLLAMARLLLDDKADVVVGHRSDAYYEGVPADRRRISRFLRWMLQTFLRLKVTDTQCGLKGFNAKGKAIFLQTSINRFLFDLEFVFLASNQKALRLLPTEAVLKPGVVFSHVNLKVLAREGWNFLRVLGKAIFRKG